MPLYDFHCRSCGNDFEALVRRGETPVCPACRSTAIERKISLPAPEGRSDELLRRARRQAAREGHFSNYSAAERAQLLK